MTFKTLFSFFYYTTLFYALNISQVDIIELFVLRLGSKTVMT